MDGRCSFIDLRAPSSKPKGKKARQRETLYARTHLHPLSLSLSFSLHRKYILFVSSFSNLTGHGCPDNGSQPMGTLSCLPCFVVEHHGCNALFYMPLNKRTSLCFMLPTGLYFLFLCPLSFLPLPPIFQRTPRPSLAYFHFHGKLALMLLPISWLWLCLMARLSRQENENHSFALPSLCNSSLSYRQFDDDFVQFP